MCWNVVCGGIFTHCSLSPLHRSHSDDYTACLQSLAKLEIAFGSSTKIMQNKAVAEFYKSEFRRYEQFRQRLNELIGDVSSTSNDDVIDIKDIALLVPLFNKSILLYQLHQPLAALKILLVLLKHLNLVETHVAQRIALLAVTILLNVNQPQKTEAVLDLLTSRLDSSGSDFMGGNNGNDGSTSTQFDWMFRLAKFRSKVMNHTSVLIPSEDSPEMVVLKAHQYYVGHDYQMAAKELAKKFTFTPPTFL